MLDSIDKVNYNYLDKIITSWHEAGIKTIGQAQAAEQTAAAKRGGKRGRKDGSGAPSFSVEQFNQFVDNYELKYTKEESDV